MVFTTEDVQLRNRRSRRAQFSPEDPTAHNGTWHRSTAVQHYPKTPFSRILFNIIIVIGIQPLCRFGQRPELSQSTGIALIRCILGKFLGVVCHCFPPPLDVPTFATRCLNDARDPSGGRWNCERECCPVILPKWRLPRRLRIFYMPQIYDMGPTALLPLRRKACWGFFRP